jgi:hypothetical protein
VRAHARMRMYVHVCIVYCIIPCYFCTYACVHVFMHVYMRPQVLNAMVSCSSLTRLDLAKSELDNQHLPGLRQVLCQTPHLLHLDLCANELSDGHLLPLEECRQLQWLGLCMNGLEALPPGLSTLTNLTLLLVGSNR